MPLDCLTTLNTRYPPPPPPGAPTSDDSCFCRACMITTCSGSTSITHSASCLTGNMPLRLARFTFSIQRMVRLS